MGNSLSGKANEEVNANKEADEVFSKQYQRLQTATVEAGEKEGNEAKEGGGRAIGPVWTPKSSSSWKRRVF